MIKFFRINDPLRLAIIFLMLVVFRVLLSVFQTTVYESELLWMLLGEKMSNGFSVYSEIDDLTAGTYWLIDLMFGRSQATHQVLSMIFVFIQLMFFNYFVNKISLLNERTYVLGFVYMLLATSAPDFFMLSPDLMATTFLLVAVYFLFQEMKESHSDDNLLALGWSFGISLAFNIHFIYFALMFFFSLLMYSTPNLRKLMLLLLGVCIPYGLISLYYVLQGGFNYFFYESIVMALYASPTNYIDYVGVLIIFGVTMFVGGVALVKVYGAQGYINYKVRCQTVFVIWIICGVLCGLMNEKHSWYSYFSLVVPVSYFISGFFMTIRKNWMRFVFVYSFIAACVLGAFNESIVTNKKESLIEYDRMIVDLKDSTNYGQILVLDDDYSLYLNNQVGSRFLNWKVASTYFDHMNYYNLVIKVNTAFEKEKPYLIFDPKHKMKEVLYRIPALNEHYEQRSPGHYFLKD